MLLNCSFIRYFVCQTYAEIILELCLFETEKYSFCNVVDLVVVFFATVFVALFLSLYF